MVNWRWQLDSDNTLSDTGFTDIGFTMVSGAEGQTDLMLGGAGADHLWGEAGSDFLDSGAGKDTYVFSAGDTSADLSLAETVNDIEGVNHIVLHGMDIAQMNLLPTCDGTVFLLQTGIDSIFIQGMKSGAVGTVQESAANGDHWRQTA